MKVTIMGEKFYLSRKILIEEMMFVLSHLQKYSNGILMY